MNEAAGEQYHDTGAGYSPDTCIHDIFAGHARETPGKVAVVLEDQALTYGELDERSTRLAGVLQRQGVKPDSLVGICAQRSLEMIIGILGCLKAGGTYMPIDPGYPSERILYLLKESGAQVLLVDDVLSAPGSSWFAAAPRTLLKLSAGHLFDPLPSPLPALAPFPPSPSSSLAYVIYTSGSTGKPKGVLVEHRQVLNTLFAMQSRYPVGQEDRYLLKTNCVFDVSITELFGWFMGVEAGGLVILEPGRENDPAAILKVMIERNVTHINFSPSMCSGFVDMVSSSDLEACKALKYVLVAGEAFPLRLARESREKFPPAVRIENIYGPTEIAIYGTWFSLSELEAGHSQVPIGRPLPRVQAYILGSAGTPQPPGVAGELHIGGAGLARGYLNRPELTAEKFDHDFWDYQDYQDKQYNKTLLRGVQGGGFLEKSPPGRRRQKKYKTGDLARWLPDGNIEFLGRIDHQVKIGGIRIECGEIEAELMRHPDLQEVVVIARSVKDNPQLVAYGVMRDKARTFRSGEARSYLRNKLPEYMIPAIFVSLEAMPLTPNGKVDRNALMNREIELQRSHEYAAPRSKREKQLAKIWEEVLGIERVGIDDNFFELGGHSLLGIQMVSRIKKELGVGLRLGQLQYEAPSIRSLAVVISQSAPHPVRSIGSIRRPQQLPLSYPQERLWFLVQLGYGEQYHIPQVMKISGDLDENALQRAIDFTAARHESLRTGFKNAAGTAIQVIAAVVEIGIEKRDLSGLSKDRQVRGSQALLREFVQRPFQLEQAPLMRVILIRLQAGTQILGMCLHHIISDAWSRGILTREITRAYAAYSQGREPGLEALKVQYADYALWQREVLTAAYLDNELEYWREHLRGYENLDLPTDYPRPKQISGKGGYVIARLEKQYLPPLKELCQEERMTLFTVLLTGVYILLRRYSRQQDICLGVPVANRNHREIEDLVGFFVNTLVSRVNPEGQDDIGVLPLLKQVRAGLAAAQDRQNVPFEKVVAALQPTRDLSRTPIFQVLVNYVTTKREELRLGDTQVQEVDFDWGISKFDLSFDFADREDGGLEVNLAYSLDLYREKTIAAMAGHLITILTRLAEEPGRAVDEIDLLTAAEKQKLLLRWNDTAAPYPKDKCIHELFEQQARAKPDRVALVLAGQTLTYRGLDERSTTAAVVLQEQGVKGDSLVGICLERSLEMIVAILGILKAGGAYLPIDPGYPPERILYVLRDSGAAVIIVDDVPGSAGSGWFASAPPALLTLSAGHLFDLHPGPLPALRPFPLSPSSSLAYVIYTSGSTGKPKGVMVEHGGVVNYLLAVKNRYGFDGIDLKEFNFSFLGNVGFDATATSFLTPLISGSMCIIYGQQEDPQDMIIKALKDPRVQVVKLTPAHLQLIPDRKPLRVTPGKLLIIGGEPLKKGLLHEFLKDGRDRVYCINQYGPTECTIASTAHLYNPGLNYSGEVYIGRPLANTRIYLLDKADKPVPVGVPGELHIAGVGLARGYLNQPELTARSFCLDFYRSYKSYKSYISKRLYKTGDLARWLADGNIEFLGRKDQQVKIRGFRIECGEIEAVLAAHPQILAAVVIARDLNRNTQLVGYYVTVSQNKPLEAIEIRNYLQNKLPAYMIPAAFASLAAIPLTPNGKVDRKALRQLEVGPGSSREYAAPRTKTEQQLTKIWEDVLGIERVGIHDNFFELGGHSLLATQIISRIHQEMAVAIPLGKLFEAPCPGDLSGIIAESDPYAVIPIASIRRPPQLPLSYAQERLWFLAQLGYSERYHVPQVMKIKGDLDEEALQKAIDYIVARHESLRTGFKTIDGKAVQVIEAAAAVEIRLRDLSGLSGEEQDRVCQSLLEEFVRQPFQLDQPPLLRIILVRLPAGTYILGMCLHHIITDAWSREILTRELTRAYAAYQRGEDPGLEPLKIQYADYAVWQRQVLTNENLAKELDYWKAHLAGYEDLDMPTDYPRPKQTSGRGGQAGFDLPGGEVRQLRKQCQEQQITLFTLLTASVVILLGKYSRQEDICLGVPVANRNHQEIENLIGFFVNTMVVRISSAEQSNIGLRQLLQAVKEEIAAGQDRQNVPFEKIVEALQPTRDLSGPPLFQAIVNYVNTGGETLQLGESRLEEVDFPYGVSKFDLLFDFSDGEDGSLRITIEYSLDLYREETILGMGGHLLKLIDSIMAEPGQAIAEIHWLTEAEKQKLLVEWNDTATGYPGDQCLPELFARQVKRAPGNVAIVFADQKLTYRELDERGSRLAIVLQGYGIEADNLVGICLERSLEMIVGILGILKAGGAYVPLDPEYPAARLRYMIEDSNARVLLTTPTLQPKVEVEGSPGQLPGLPLQAIHIETVLRPAVEPTPSTSIVTCRVRPANLAYVIYTSGTTGKPKGTLTTHYNVIRVVKNTNYIQLTAIERILQLSNFAFDGSVFDIFGALLNGARLVMIEKERALSPDRLAELMGNEQITCFFVTTAFFNTLVDLRIDCLANIKKILFGGERVSVEHVEKARAFLGEGRIIHVYGPTETTVYATYYPIDHLEEKPGTIPIGKPISNTVVYILDKFQKLLPIGIAGEIHIGGDGLARGYLNRPELTAEKFIPAFYRFYRSYRSYISKKLYKTGDLARWLAEGNIEFLGRIDHQVKIRGFRIECGEIEAVLTGHPEVRQAIVVPRSVNNTVQLVAYYVAVDKGKVLAVSETRGYLQGKLPDYMIPAAFVSLEAIPLTANGKVDGNALLQVEVKLECSGEYIAPRTGTQERLARIWEEVLGAARVGIHDNFFQLGGHSLLAVQIISRINKEFGADLPLRQLFEFSRIESLSLAIEKSKPSREVPIASIRRPEPLPLSYAQERLWFLAQLGYSKQYHVPQVMKIKGDLDEEALQKTMNFMVARHESLRTGFKTVEGTAIQVIAAAEGIEIEKRDLSAFSKEEQEQICQTLIRDFVQTPFELSRAPLLRVMLVTLAADTYIFGICMHHIISDGWSMGIFTREISQSYAAFREGKQPGLEELKIQYADYTAWQRQVMTEEKLEKELSYWKAQLAGYEDLDLPTDYPRPKQISGKGGHARYRLQREEAAQLKKLCQKEQVTLFTLLTASVYLLLRRYSRQHDICMGIPTANRDHREIEELIGFFVNTLVIRIDTGEQSGITVRQLLKKVQDEIAAGQNRQNVPFEKVVEAVQPLRDLSRTPIFRVMINYVDTGRMKLQLGESQVEGVGFEYGFSKFDLMFAFSDREDDSLGIILEYNRDLYREDTAARMGEHLVKIMTNLVEEPGKAVDEIELLSEEEKQKLLIEWNNTAVEYPRGQAIHGLFRAQVEKTPGKVAAEFNDEQLTYRELDKRVTGLALYLQKQGIKPNCLVGIFVERSLSMVVGILGSLTAGGVYVPIDPDSPPARIKYLVEDSQIMIVLTQGKSGESVPGLLFPKGSQVIVLDKEWDKIKKAKGKLIRSVQPHHLAYVIYTSGSTGKPKGVMVEHQNILNTLFAVQSRYPVDPDDTYLLKTNYVFDVSLTELFGWFMGAGRLVILNPGQEKYPLAIFRVLSERRVTHINFVPSSLGSFLDLVPESGLRGIKYLKYVMVAGELFPKMLALESQEKFAPWVRLENIYGPTEVSIYGTWFSVNGLKSGIAQVPIGLPLPNVQAYILSQLRTLQPPGIPGELHLGGAGLARGYLNQPELTCDKFDHDLWDYQDKKLLRGVQGGGFLEKSPPGRRRQKIYKTGDLARWLPEGNIEFLGRIDHQVKVRGFRIECGEIEAVLARHPHIQEAVVIDRRVNNMTQLVAYSVPSHRDKTLEASETRSYLQQTLPDYMIPTAFVTIAAIPLTPSGKVDRKALQQREVELESSRAYVAPRTKTEKQLARIWEEVLDAARVGVHDNFFELGGHSLLAIRIISRINKELEVEVLLSKLFEFPRLEDLSKVVEESNPYRSVPIASIRRPDRLPLSYAQERLWFLAQLGYSEQYHVPRVIKIKGDLDEEALQKTMNYLVARHESLRTGFKTVEGTAVQFIVEIAGLEIARRDLSAFSQEEQDRICQTLIRDFVQKPFELSQAPLVRVILVMLASDTYIFGICMHHIVSDGWSMGILTREISQAYAAYRGGREPRFAELKVQYADYAVWQREIMSEARLEQELDDWKTHLAGYEDLDLPTDYPRPQQISGKGSHARFRLQSEEAAQLKKRCQKEQLTLFTMLMASVYLLLRQYSRQEDICLGMPAANRDRREIEDLVGFFVNTLVIRIDTGAKRGLTVRQLLKNVQQEIVSGQDRQHVPFEKIVEALQPSRNLSRTPIFQVLVNYVNTGRKELQLGETQLEAVELEYGISKFDLMFAFADREDGGLLIAIEYSRDLYREDTAVRMGGHLVKIMMGLAESPGRAIDDIQLLTAEEKQKLLSQWSDRATGYTGNQCLPSLFQEQVKKTAEQAAVVFADQTLTYRALDQQSTALAVALRQQGVTSDRLVAVCLERSIETIIAIMAILKAGGTYLPIDPGYPPERILYLLKDSGAQAIIVDSVLAASEPRWLAAAPRALLKLSAGSPCHMHPAALPALRSLPPSPSSSLAYVIYTSGSTGKPKGVMQTHRTVINLIAFQQTDSLSLKSRPHVAQFAAHGFDVSIQEIFYSFFTGSVLYVLSEETKPSPAEVIRFVRSRQIDILYLPTAYLEYFAAEANQHGNTRLKCLETIIVAGEALKISPIIKEFFTGFWQIRLENQYGPSETHVVTRFVLPRDRDLWQSRPPIGRPIANLRIYILSFANQPVPVGVPGELHIAGAGLARGYLNQPGLTARSFLPDFYRSYRSYKSYVSRNLYKTGDLARWLPEGDIEFLGRQDHQVKIRGFRIECGEIEAELARHPQVREAVVISRSVNNNTQLVAYYVGMEKDRVLTASEIRSYLWEKLPEYMIPAAFVPLEAIPLTPNGKVDRNFLGKQEVELLSSREYTPPRTETEKQLARIWQEVLGVSRVGLHDNFFELGGHSLLAVQIISRINNRLGTAVSLRRLFEAPRLEDLSRVVAESTPYREVPIASIERPEPLPLSYAQERLWFLVQLGYSEQYHIPTVMKINGQLNQDALQKSLDLAANRHETLRTRFKTLEGKASQVIDAAAEIKIERHDLSGFGKEERDRESQLLLREFIQRPFALERAAPLRVLLVKMEENTHIFGMCLHHIIFDGWSLGILLREISRAYTAYGQGKEPVFEPLAVQYADYAVWQRQVMNQARLENELNHWQEHLAGYQDLDLPGDYPRPRQISGKGGHVGSRLPEAESRQLKKQCREKQVTFFTVLMAGVYLLLRRYGRQQDICLGMPAAHRNHREIEAVVGFFVNTLVIRIDIEEDPGITVEQLLEQVQAEIVSAQDHQEVPFEKIVEVVHPARDLSRTPIFQVLVNYVNARGEELQPDQWDQWDQWGECRLEGVGFDYGVSKFDLTFGFAHVDGGVGIHLNYSRDLYREETMERMTGHLVKILAGLAAGPGNSIDDIRLMTAAERETLLFLWNDTAAAYPGDRSLRGLFVEQVEKTPHRAALRFKDQTLDYRELEQRSGTLARVLQAQGVKPDSAVGICLERSLEMVIGILGILAAGGAYLPIDPGYPPERIEYLLDDSGAEIWLTTPHLSKEISYKKGIVNVTDELNRVPTPPRPHLSPWVNAPVTSLAYVIYTSGSTGKPKGVIIENRAIVNRVTWMQRQYGLGADDRVLQKTPFGFDVSVWEFFWPLTTGARLIAALPGKHKDPGYLAALIQNEKITTLHFVPSMLRAFLEVDHLPGKVSSLKRLICSGEALSKDLKDHCLARLDCELHNLYGPTEASVDVSYWACEKEYPWGVPIGRPIANTQLYILGNNNKPEPVGVPGELHIAGVGLARGYLNQPELTARRFFHNFYRSYRSYKSYISKKLYKTGDLARWLPDGNIEYLGRMDHQVKIRGFRIECGEIEAELARHPRVREAVVIAGSVNNTTQLVAYYAAAEQGRRLERGEIRDYLQKRLPEYMIPAAFVLLETIPLTANGKIDRKALLQLETGLESSREYAAPRTGIEKQVARIWEEVLGPERVGIHDNFFELGGHSLLAIQIISRINKEIGVEVLLSQLFETPVLEDLCRVIAGSNINPVVPITSIRRPAQLPLSYAQERLWFLVQLGYSEQYHIPKALKVKGELDIEALHKALHLVVGRHESLRTGFKTVDGKVIQFIIEVEDLEIEQEDLSGFSEAEQEREGQNLLREFVRRPFELSQPPLLRVILVKLAGNLHIFGMCLHHITADAWSMGILTREISRAYAAYGEGKEPRFAELKVQYADYAVWQREIMNEARLEQEINDWKTHLAGYQDLDLPTDYPRPKQLSGKGGHVVHRLEKEHVRTLKKWCQEMQVTLFTLLTASVYILLRRYSRQTDLCLGFTTANRDMQEIEALVGFFINTLVSRLNTGDDGHITAAQLLKNVQEEIAAAQDRRGVPFEKVVEILQPARDLSRTPIFQVLVNYVNAGREELELGASQLEAVDFDYGISKFDLTFAFTDHTDGGVGIILEYSRDLYRPGTIERMKAHLVTIMTGLAEAPGKAADEIELLTGEEKQTLLLEWTGPAAHYPRDRCIHELFREQAGKTPGKTAVVFADQTLTYRELEVRSTKLALVLQKQGVTPDRLVGIFLERSLEMIVGILGIWEAGGAYLPIDTGYPEERKRYMLKDSGTKILLTSREITTFSSPEAFNQRPKGTANHPHLSPRLKAPATSLAYIIYTSGSTGKPKGVMVEQQQILNTLYALQSRYPVHRDDTYLLKTNYVFDVSLTELLGWWIGAGRLVILEPGLEKDPLAILKVLIERQITHINFVPSMLSVFLEMVSGEDLGMLHHLKYVMVAGEVFPKALALESREKFARTVNIENIYGPTEAAVYGTWFSVRGLRADAPQVPLGKPLYNVQVYILGPGGIFSPPGVFGELHLGGAGLARGYLNQPGLTCDKFKIINYKLKIKNGSGALRANLNACGEQFSEPQDGSKSHYRLGGTPLYKTGDLARWLADGNIEFLGRIDRQVKIRGFRIECGEIEAKLAQHPGIREAVVIAGTMNNTTQLIGFYVTKEGDHKLDTNETRSYLQGKLPDYMIPAVFVSLEEIPLTPNGKVDRKGLLKHNPQWQSSREYAPPRTEAEKQLTQIWEEVLGLERVGIHDNFFELGGHSLLAIRMVTKIRDRLGVECPVRNIFAHSTVYDLAKLFPALPGAFSGSETGVNIPRRHIKANKSIPLGDSQFMFWLFWVGAKDTRNIYRIYDVKGPLEVFCLEQAFNTLVQRHESLRARFWRWKPAQEIIPTGHVPISVIDLRGRDAGQKEESLKETRSKVGETLFDLTSPPLIRLCVIQLEVHRYKLLLVAPHIVIDEVAFNTLFDELIAFYKALVPGRPLPPPRTGVQLSDYVYWEHETAQRFLRQNLDYWQQKLEKVAPLSIPGSLLLPPDQTVLPHQARLDPTLLDALAKISREHNVSLQMSLSAIIAVVLHRLTSQSDICIQTLFENRIHQDTKYLVSSLVTLLPIRTRVSREISFPDLLEQMRQTTLEGYHHIPGFYTMPLSFLHRTGQQKDDPFILRARKHVIRFFTWLLSRVVFPARSYPALYYTILVTNAMKEQAKNRSQGKMPGTRGKISPRQDRESIEVYLNLMPNFTKSPGTSACRCGDVRFSPGTLPAPGNPIEGLKSEQANVIYFGFLNDQEGNPLLQIRGKNFTPSALQQVATSFGDVLAAVVKNPRVTLPEILAQSPPGKTKSKPGEM